MAAGNGLSSIASFRTSTACGSRADEHPVFGTAGGRALTDAEEAVRRQRLLNRRIIEDWQARILEVPENWTAFVEKYLNLPPAEVFFDQAVLEEQPRPPTGLKRGCQHVEAAILPDGGPQGLEACCRPCSSAGSADSCARRRSAWRSWPRPTRGSRRSSRADRARRRRGRSPVPRRGACTGSSSSLSTTGRGAAATHSLGREFYGTVWVVAMYRCEETTHEMYTDLTEADLEKVAASMPQPVPVEPAWSLYGAPCM